MIRSTCVLLLLWADLAALGYEASDYAFLVSAQAGSAPPQIILQWPAKGVSEIAVHRKLLGGESWGPAIATLPGNTTWFGDGNVAVGQAYEYQVSGILTAEPGAQRAYGYVCAGIQIPSIDRRGKVVLIADRSHAAALAAELETWRKDLIGDGWSVARYDVWPGDPVPFVKSLILNEYNADPANVRAVFLFGHVPVPYSGLINPDMHANHLGAWPADAYFGEMNGEWTDFSVNRTGAEFPENNNVPGDGKFDQSTIPGPVELEVGRVDFWNLPAFGARSERELLRNYLNKNHRFRHRTVALPLRGLIRDHFGVITQDAPAVDAWRAFPALFGPGGLQEIGAGAFFPVLQNEGYLFAYGGGGGDFTKADGVGTTADFAANDPRAAFLLLHGSYFGDWNNEDNFLRAALATPNYSVASIWSSLPHWYMHPLALGETIGFVTRLTQNNRAGLYRNQVELSTAGVHTSLLGDPTLRPLPLAPPGNLRLNAGASLTLSWDPSWQVIDGYHIYRASSFDEPFLRVNRRIVTETTFAMDLPGPGHHVFMVKAAALQTTGSGSFHNLSQGIFIEYDQSQPEIPNISIAATDASGDENGDELVFQLTRNNNLAGALTIHLQLSGSATAGQDFPPVPATLTFPGGFSTTTFSIRPTQDSINELDETIVITVAPGSGYNVVAPASATGIIRGAGESRILSVDVSNDGAFGFAASGFAGRSYRVESRLTDGGWRLRATGAAPADGTVHYRETSPAPAGSSELYRIVWE